jgi:F-type H+-transporting ATPase subunit g
LILISDKSCPLFFPVNVSSYADSFMYNLRVAGALFKQVYLAEGLAPPRSLQVIQDAYKTMYARAIDSNWWTNLVKSGEWQKTAIYAIEAYGIFHIGQMVRISTFFSEV